jgi:hypothetical protein
MVPHNSPRSANLVMILSLFPVPRPASCPVRREANRRRRIGRAILRLALSRPALFFEARSGASFRRSPRIAKQKSAHD